MGNPMQRTSLEAEFEFTIAHLYIRLHQPLNLCIGLTVAQFCDFVHLCIRLTVVHAQAQLYFVHRINRCMLNHSLALRVVW